MVGIHVQKIRIRNFRSLRQVETTLGEVTLLLGANNSGKTSFLRALAIALSSDRTFVSRDDLFIDGQGKPPSEPVISIDLKLVPQAGQTFTDQWAQVFGEDIQIDPAGNEFFAYRTFIDYSANQTEAKIRRYVITNWEANTADENQEVRANLAKTPLFFIDAQRDLQEDLKYAQSYFGRLASRIEYEEEQKKKLEKALDTLNKDSVENSAVLAHLKTNLEELNKTVNTRGRGVEITPFPKKLRDLHKGLKVHFQDGGSETFSLEYHGMGTRSWASLLGYKAFIEWMTEQAEQDGDVLYPILALEEPEAHLHPNAQRQVYGQLKRMQGQKIISTHSPFIAPLAELSELRLFYKARDATEINSLMPLSERISSKDRHTLENAIMRNRGELLFARLVVLYEGQTEDRALPVFAKHHWGCEAFEKGVALIYCEGSNYKLYLRLLETLGIPWSVFSDYDNDTVRSNVRAGAKAINIASIEDDPRIICLNAPIEQYLLDQGYRQLLEDALHAITEPVYANEQHRLAKKNERQHHREELRQLNDSEFLKRVDEWKAKMAPLWAQAIVEHDDPAKRMPQKIQELFVAVDEKLK